MEGCAMGRHLGDGFHPRRSRITTQPASPPPHPFSGHERLTIEVRNTKLLFHKYKMICLPSHMTPIQYPLISGIISAWNGLATIVRGLDAVRALTLRSEDLERIGVDNGSTDGTAESARSVPGVIVLTEHRPCSYAVRNRGLAHARGPYVAFTHADCCPASDSLEKELAAAGRPPDS